MQEAQVLIIRDSILKRSVKNTIPIGTSKTLPKDKGQKIERLLQIDTLAHRSSYGEKTSVLADQLFSVRPEVCALPFSQKAGWWCFLAQISRMRKSSSTISNLHSTISKRHKFANCAEHIH